MTCGETRAPESCISFLDTLGHQVLDFRGLVVNTSVVSVEGRGLGEKCGGNPGKMVASLAREEGGHTLLSPSVSQKEVTTSPWEAEAELNISL